MSGAVTVQEGEREAALAVLTLTMATTSPSPSTGRCDRAAHVHRRLGRIVTGSTPKRPAPSSPSSSHSPSSPFGVFVPRRPGGVVVRGLLLVLLSSTAASASASAAAAGNAATAWIRDEQCRSRPRSRFSGIIGRPFALRRPEGRSDPPLSVRGGDAEDAKASAVANPQDGSADPSAPHDGRDSKEEVGEGGAAAPDASTVWGNLVESTRATFPECPVQDLLVPCDLETFHSMFLSDDAPHPIADYQETRVGDSDLVTSPWTAIGDGEGDDSGDEDRARVGGGDALRRREITYIHPVSNPMAPPKAKATKRQFLKRFFSSSVSGGGGEYQDDQSSSTNEGDGEGGIIMETVTTVQDVPKTDCFYVEDRLLVSPTSSDREVRVEARFGIRFIKKTMVRSIIQRSTTKEFNSWFEGLGEYFVDKLKEGSSASLSNSEE